MRFVVRTMSSLARRAESRSAAEASPGPRRNPFLPYEDALYVAAITPTHVALLNKFPVQDDHLLIVTRAFAPQEALLDADDFLALAACLAEVDGLAFYNGGEVAGASQPHKHLQLVPLPLADGIAGVPIDVALEPIRTRSFVDRGAGPAVPLRVCSVRSRSAARSAIRRAGRSTAATARSSRPPGSARARSAASCTRTRPTTCSSRDGGCCSCPARRECFGSISLNALAFGGALFVRARRNSDACCAPGR